MPDCYLCGFSPAPHKLELKKTFTAHSLAKSRQSDGMCDRCYITMNGELKQLAYWSEKKNDWSVIFARNTSWLLKHPRELDHPDNLPLLSGKKTVKGKELKIIQNIPSRKQIREWLVNPPETPFEIAIADSGQKHILPFSQEARSRDKFPVLFELDLIHFDRAVFTELLNHYEFLMQWFSKGEINSGDYRSDRLMKALGQYENSEAYLDDFRGTRLFDLVGHVSTARSRNHAINY